MSSKEYRPRRTRPAIPFHVITPLVLGAITLGLFIWSGLTTITPAPRVVIAQVVPVVAQAPESPEAAESEPAAAIPTKTVQAPGWIEPDPYLIAAAALADGVVEEILVLEGESVRKDQPVARLVADDARLSLRAATAATAVSESRLLVAQARLASAEADWAHPIELERAVESARASVAELDAKLEQLPFEISEARALSLSRGQEAERLRQAAEAGSASEIEVIIAEAAAEAQAAVVDQLERQADVLRAQRARVASDLRAAERDLELRIDDTQRLASAQAEVGAAQAQLEDARTKLAEAELRMSRMTIYSPIDGLVMQRMKSPGDKVMMGMDDPHSAHIVHVYAPEKLQVRVDVPLADAAHIAVGQRAEVFCEVLPEIAFEGVVTRITNLADLQRNTLEVKVQIINPAPILKPEMLSRVRFLGSTEAGGPTRSEADEMSPEFLLPRGAVRKGDTVLVVRDRSGLRGRVDRVAIQIAESGATSEEHVSVTGRLRSTDLVVLGEADLQPGVLVEFSGQSETVGSGGAAG